MLQKIVIKIFKKIIPKKYISYLKTYLKLKFNEYHTISFAQEGEDLFLKRIFSNKKNGFYVDVGAHHPFLYSSTYIFYQNG